MYQPSDFVTNGTLNRCDLLGGSLTLPYMGVVIDEKFRVLLSIQTPESLSLSGVFLFGIQKLHQFDPSGIG